MKNFLTIAIIFLLGFTFCYFYISSNSFKNVNDITISKDVIKELKSIGLTDNDLLKIDSLLSEEDLKLLKNVEEKEYLMNYIEINNFKLINLPRYVKYELNNDYDKNNVINYVNIGLDKPFYTDIKIVENSNDKLVLINKYFSLPSGFVPNNLVSLERKYNPKNISLEKETFEEFDKMMNDVKENGYTLFLISGYRSEEYQNNLYNYNVKIDGVDETDKTSARVNHSEHQTGLAIDIGVNINSLKGFENEKIYSWLKENAHKYGFIERYPKDKEFITGYSHEPWHYRYVGKKVAKYIYENNITFEEYYVKFLDK